MGHIDDVLVGPDPVEARYFIIGQIISGHLQTPAGMRKTDNGALRLRPLEDRKITRRPVLELLRAWIVLLFQVQQNDVPRVAGWKAGNFEIVMHQAIGLRKRVVRAGEELLLTVVARPTG